MYSVDISSLAPVDPTRLIQGEEIGRGAFGVVYKGTYSGNPVAIKALYRFTQDALDGFKRDLTVMMSLHHPNIVGFRGDVIGDLDFRIVMEFMSKGNLSQLLLSQEKVSWFVLARIALDVAEGLNYLHSREIFHGDIKSQNILLDDNLRAKISDFGTSRFKDENSFGYWESGTYAYMPPEAIKHERESKNTKAADVYSYGVVCWELGSQKPPFAGQEIFSIIKKVMNGSEIREKIDKSTPYHIKEIIKKCWKHDPELRPTMEQILEVLKKASFGEKENQIRSSGAI